MQMKLNNYIVLYCCSNHKRQLLFIGLAIKIQELFLNDGHWKIVGKVLSHTHQAAGLIMVCTHVVAPMYHSVYKKHMAPCVMEHLSPMVFGSFLRAQDRIKLWVKRSAIITSQHVCCRGFKGSHSCSKPVYYIN